MNKDLEIYVGNISTSVDVEDLKNAFNDFTIKNCRLLGGGTKKYAFLQLDSEASISRVLREMNGQNLQGKKMIIRAGNRNVHDRICREIESEQSKHKRNSQEQDFDQGPPPLETCYKSHYQKQDVPPPLVLADVPLPLIPADVPHPLVPADIPPPLVPADVLPPLVPADVPPPLVPADVPPPLVPAFPEDLPPLEEAFPQRPRQEVIRVTKPAFHPAKSKQMGVENGPITLVVANFPFGTTEEDLLWLFKKYSPLKATVILNTRLKDEKTYAYVTVPGWDLAEQAIAERDDFTFKNRNLMVTYVLERVHHCL